MLQSLTGSAPMTTVPQTISFNILYKKSKICHVTCDMWQMTFDTLHMTCGGRGTFSLAPTVWDWRCFKNIFTEDDSVTDIPSDWHYQLVQHPWLPVNYLYIGKNYFKVCKAHQSMNNMKYNFFKSAKGNKFNYCYRKK